jgi:hypothetical protein
MACTLALTPYSLKTLPVVIRSAGIYTLEYYVTACNRPRTLMQTQTFAISATCQFDRALSANAQAVRVGTPLLLRWCDPSVVSAPDQGYSVTFYRILMSRTPNGPFVSIADVQRGSTTAGINFDATDVGPAFFFVEAYGSGDTVLRSNIVRADIASSTGCLPDATTLCLNGGRFQTTVQWRTSDGKSGRGQAIPLTGDSGYFWFFGPENVEMTVKVLNACSTSTPRYWVFASGMTDVGVDLTVTDTKTGAVKTYSNPLGRPFQAVQDTNAFATCP